VARTQYTSGSFAGIAAGWFAWVLRSERKMRRPRGLFPAEALRLEYFPETVLERIIAPAGAMILQISTAVRRLQHGRLQAYILYVVAGLVAMGILVLLGGQP
jgi:hydrogenase-4 component B